MSSTSMTITIGYSPAYLAWTGSHASPMRAHLAVEHIQAQAHEDNITVEIIDPETTLNAELTRKDLALVHDPAYVERVFAGNEPGAQGTVQAHTATVMFEGTRVLVERIDQMNYTMGLYFNPQGAKHHAAKNHSSGFCVFNDMAWAARHFTDKGLRVAYLDWDAHHGDGVEDLTRDNLDVLTASIHQWGIFPGTGKRSTTAKSVYNYPLDAHADDDDLMEAVQDALYAIEQFKPDVLLVAIGADGHTRDPLANLDFTVEGFALAGAEVGRLARALDIPVLVGGAGGYTPFTYVPLVWAEVIRTMHEEMFRRGPDVNIDMWTDEANAWDEDDRADDTQSRIDAIMEDLRGFPVEKWEDLLRADEAALVEPVIRPILMKHHEATSHPRRDRRSRRKQRAGRRG